MVDYDFGSLNDKEFEVLVADLMNKVYNERVERFKPGRDLGVDGRFFTKGDEVIIQCKHWVNSNINQLISNLKAKELPKIEKLKPKGYVFVTSLNLTRLNKQDIAKIFKGNVQNETDIFGREDLNDILSKNPEIEKRHYKLWLSSTNILQIIFNSGIIGRSRHSMDSIKQNIPRYIQTTNHKNALIKLEDIHSVIITGEPGIGKTTLADHLCYFYAAKGFEFIQIEESISEAEGVYDENAKQVFYYDDFLGRNHLLALEHHQDSKIVKFIERVKKDRKKRFILTSRTNIINQGKRLSELFALNHIEQNEYEIRISSLKPIDKARILYNHIWFGNLKKEFIDEIYLDKRYHNVISHKNFNPRLIAFITDQNRMAHLESQGYWDFVKDNLTNPKEVWRNFIEVQIDQECRHIIIGVVLHSKPISEKSLHNFIERIMSSPLGFDHSKTIESLLKLMVGALLNRNRKDDNIEYDLFNPSIGDFIIANYLSNTGYITNLLYALRTYESLIYLIELKLAGKVSSFQYDEIIRNVFLRLRLESNLDITNMFDLTLINQMMFQKNIEDLQFKDYVIEFGSKFDGVVLNSKQIQFLQDVIDSGVMSSIPYDVEKIVIETLDGRYFDEQELKDVGKLFQASKNETIRDAYRNLVLGYYYDNITDLVINESTFSELYDEDEFRESDLIYYLESTLIDYDFEITNDEFNQMVSSLDLHKLIEYNIDVSNDPGDFYDETERYSGKRSNDSLKIDDLFERE